MDDPGSKREYTASATRHLLHGVCYTTSATRHLLHTASAAHGVCYTASATRRLLHGVCYTASATRRLLHTVSATRRLLTRHLLHGVPDFSCPEDLQRTGLLADDGSFLTRISGFDFHLQTFPDGSTDGPQMVMAMAIPDFFRPKDLQQTGS